MLKALKLSAVALALLFAAAQFIRPARVNPPLVAGQSLEENAHVPKQVSEILNRSCMDCHSNRTQWPWYSEVAPVSWLVVYHVNDGRRNLNFSEWASYGGDAAELLRGVCGESKNGYMPPGYYVLTHRSAALSPADVKTLCDWADAERRRLIEEDDAVLRSP